MGILMRSGVIKSNETMRLVVTAFFGVAFGFLIGVSFQPLSLAGLSLTSSIAPTVDISNITEKMLDAVDEKISGVLTLRNNNTGPSQAPGVSTIRNNNTGSSQVPNLNDASKIWIPSNPRGAERLPPGIVAAESDFYLRRLWGLPKDDLPSKPKYLITFTVGYEQKKNIDAAVKKFSENFTILLFHYDGRTSEWEEFEWSKRAIHVSAQKQTKWWYAKRFLHPDIVAPYDYLFIWDEDLGLEHFNAEEYINLVRKYGLEISQPALDPSKRCTWTMTKRRSDHEVHKESGEKKERCSGTHQPPCAAFVEIMAPVFSRDAWRCVWHMIQNDLVHGWGLDFALRRCAQPAHEKIGVVDAQWIVHQSFPTLGNQGEAENGKAPWRGVKERCGREWKMFRSRFENADKEYFKSLAATH